MCTTLNFWASNFADICKLSFDTISSSFNTDVILRHVGFAIAKMTFQIILEPMILLDLILF